MCQAAIEISIRKFRVQLDGSVIINNCRTIVFQDRKHITSIIISIDKIRSQLNHLVQIALYHFIVRSFHGTLLSRTGFQIILFFHLLVFQLLITDESTVEINREEMIFYNNSLIQIFNGTCKILHQIKVQ